MPSDVPTGWARQPLTKLGSFHKSRGASKKDEQEHGIPVVRYGELYTRHNDVIRGFHSFVSEERAADYTKLQVGDLLFAGSGETLAEIGKSAVYLGPEEAHGSGDIIILRPNSRVDPLFLGYASNGPDAVGQKSRMGQGSSVMHIYAHNLEKLALNVPPLPEQKKIAAILSSVDEAIQATQAVIEQTRRVKEGLLQDLLTKGIGPGGKPHTRFKQTEIGEIPEGWEVRKLGTVVQSLDSKRVPVKSADRKEMSGTIPYYGASGIIDWVDEALFDEELLLIGEDGANLINRNSPIAFVISGPSWVNNHAHVYRSKGRVLLQFVAHWVESLNLERWVTGSAQPKLNGKVAARIPVPFPPLQEQARICSVAAAASSVIDTEGRKLAQLQQTKAGLLQDLLTGKVRVSV